MGAGTSGIGGDNTPNQEGSEVTDKYKDWYGPDMPHRPPAVEGDNEDTIWAEIIEDESMAVRVAESMNYQNAHEMDTVFLVIRDDFREFLFPLNRGGGVYETNLEYLKDHHLSNAGEFNDEITYDHTVKRLDVSGSSSDDEEDESEDVDWDNIMSDEDGSENEDDAVVSEDLDEVFG